MGDASWKGTVSTRSRPQKDWETPSGRTVSGFRSRLAREWLLEAEADRILQSLPDDPDCPAYSEAHLRRSYREHGLISMDSLEPSLASLIFCQAARDEILFLASLTPLNPAERACLRGWLLGLTQRETVERWQALFPVRTQQTVSRCLRNALCKCYASTSVSFVQFSRHTIYRRPLRRGRG